MTACTACGHAPLTGRYCSNCGVPAASGIAHEPTPIGTPPPARFPMFADELTPESAPRTEPAPTLPPETATYPVAPAAAAPASAAPDHGDADDPRRPRPTPWQLGIGIVVLLGVLGAILMLVGGGDGETVATDPRPSAAEASVPDAGGADGEGDSGAASVPPVGQRLDPADVAVPGTAAPSRDNDGNPVTYGAANLFDEDPRTAWRVAGDASGAVLTFRFDEPVTVTDVGLINGYAKEDPPNDWYAANRRVTAVEWAFGDGTTTTQELTAEREVQRMEIDAVETDVVELRLTGVSAPRSRDYTAISEVSLTGSR